MMNKSPPDPRGAGQTVRSAACYSAVFVCKLYFYANYASITSTLKLRRMMLVLLTLAILYNNHHFQQKILIRQHKIHRCSI